jgi:hypothetical protein
MAGNMSQLDDAIIAKIKKLVPQSLETRADAGDSNLNERCLSALLLSTRLSSTTKLQRIFYDRNILIDFILLLVEENATGTTLYARLAAQLAVRLAECEPDRDERDRATFQQRSCRRIASALCGILDLRTRDTKKPLMIEVIDVEIVIALNELAARLVQYRTRTDGDGDIENALLETILEQAWKLAINAAVQTEEAKGVSLSNDPLGPKLKQPSEIMHETLTQLLNQSSNVVCEQSLSVQMSAETTRLFFDHASRITNYKIPSYYRSALNWAREGLGSSPSSFLDESRESPSTTSERSSLRSASIQIILWTSHLLAALPTFQAQIDANEMEISEGLARLIVAGCVSSSAHHQDQSDTFRSLSWSTLGTLVQAIGWRWLYSVQWQHTSVFGSAHSVCILLRLAVGEWKIQLGFLLSETEDNEPDSQSLLNDSKVSIFQTCAQVIISAVEYVVELATEVENDGSLSVPVDAVLHLRESLYECLDAIVQYFASFEESLTKGVRAELVDVCVIRVMSSLLMEMDAFETTLPTSTTLKEDGEQENAVLGALRRAMNVDIKQAREALLPGLASVFSSAKNHEDESDIRVSLLKDYDLVGESLVDFLTIFWNERDADGSSIEWACRTTELWLFLTDVTKVSTIQDGIVRWLQLSTIAQTRRPSGAGTSIHGGKESTQQAVYAAVGCYAFLQGDTKPGEPHASILQCALQECSELVE